MGLWNTNLYWHCFPSVFFLFNSTVFLLKSKILFLLDWIVQYYLTNLVQSNRSKNYTIHNQIIFCYTIRLPPHCLSFSSVRYFKIPSTNLTTKTLFIFDGVRFYVISITLKFEYNKNYCYHVRLTITYIMRTLDVSSGSIINWGEYLYLDFALGRVYSISTGVSASNIVND